MFLPLNGVFDTTLSVKAGQWFFKTCWPCLSKRAQIKSSYIYWLHNLTVKQQLHVLFTFKIASDEGIAGTTPVSWNWPQTQHSMLPIKYWNLVASDLVDRKWQLSSSLSITPPLAVCFTNQPHKNNRVGHSLAWWSKPIITLSCSLIIIFWCFVKRHLHCISSSYPLVPPADVLSLFLMCYQSFGVRGGWIFLLTREILTVCEASHVSEWYNKHLWRIIFIERLQSVYDAMLYTLLLHLILTDSEFWALCLMMYLTMFYPMF